MKVQVNPYTNYVYVGNVPGSEFENTYCHNCNELIVERYAYQIKNFMKEKGKCPVCDAIAYGIY